MKRTILIGSLVAMSSLSALAATEPQTKAAGTNQTAATMSRFTDKLYVNFFSFFHGGPLNDLDSPYQVDKKGKRASPILFDSSLVGAYMINKDIGVGPEFNFLYSPVMGQDFILNDSGVRIFHHHLVHIGNFNMSGNLILQAPTSTESRHRDQVLGVKTSPVLTYVIPNSKFVLGAFTELKWYAGVSKGKTFKMYAEPWVNYRLNKSLALTLMYEMDARHDVGKDNFDFYTYVTDLQPGFKWNITPKIWVNPYLMLYTGNKVNTQSTTVNATMSFTL